MTTYSPSSSLLYRLYERRLLKQIPHDLLPHHIGVMVDGNRRWAKKRDEEVAVGHRVGAERVIDFLGWCDDLDIEVVTVYLLSQGNLTNRSTSELDDLLGIIRDLSTALAEHGRANWRIRHVGSVDGLPVDLVAAITAAVAETADNPGMTVNLAIGYGGRREISDAVRKILVNELESGSDASQMIEAINEAAIAENLYTGGMPDPDLILRASGEQRISDFLLWQSANSEFYFSEVLWPDFRRVDFLRALRSYVSRDRRFGK